MSLKKNYKLRTMVVTSVVCTMMLGMLFTPIYAGATVFAKDNEEADLTYIVKNSEGLKIEKQRIITVDENNADFGVGQGIQWPKQVNSPFIDMVAWVTKPGYANNGAANLAKISEDTGVEFFNLGFIQPISNTIKDGKVQWGWGGYQVLNEENKDNDQYTNGIKKSIKDLREMGGDVTISLGGLNGSALWEATQDVDVLTNTYREIVKGYGLTRLDLDIEGGAQNKNYNIANAKAIKNVQDETGVDIVLTLPVLPSGLTTVQLDLLEAYLANGVDVKLVNIMTMCYGSGTLLPGENYGTGSIRAIDSTKDQVKNYFKKYANIQLSDEEAYGKIGTTSSIGFEGEAHPIFTTEWSKLLVNHSIEKGLGMTSFWSMNRDAMLESNKGVSSQYEFTNIFKQFGSDNEGGVVNPPANTKPTISGVKNQIITIGDKFDLMAGVTARDKEDGDLTSKIKVEGNVNTEVAGQYNLTYTVVDSEGLKDVKECCIKVKEVSEIEDTYDSNKIYLEGDTVIYKGNKYTAKWWIKGEDPDKSEAWKKEVIPNEDGSVDYEEGSIYVEGDKVSYNGKMYETKWWTKSIPGSDDSWKLIA
ncbi:DUF5011 domain-containing protein [Clostridium botulinum]|nr:DUF5011 domain-containing protein [Clostridium botulinum]